MKVNKNMVSGNTAMLILKLISEKDMYGYEMIDTLRGKSKNVFELKAGTLYPLLHGLEEKGFVESYEKEAVGKIRKYYHITRSGKKELKKNPPINEQMIKTMMSQMGRTPSQKQVNQMMKQMNKFM